jgi:hypothetical protein
MILLTQTQQMCHILQSTLKEMFGRGMSTVHCYQDKEEQDTNVQDVEFHCVTLVMEKVSIVY